MKKIVLALSVVLFSATTFAQKNVIKANLLGPIGGSYTMAYERVLNEKMSVQLSVGYRTFKVYEITLSTVDEKLTYSGPTVVGEFRYYLTNASQDVPRGFYLAPFARFGSYTYKYTYTNSDPNYSINNYNGKYTISSIAGGGMLGYQWLIVDKLSLDLFAGPQYKTKSVSNITYTYNNGTTNTVSSSGSTILSNKGFGSPFGIRAGFNIGFAF